MNPQQKPEPAHLLAVSGLTVKYPQSSRRFKLPSSGLPVLHEISFQQKAKETLGLAGESGCGKTTLARTLVRLIRPLSGTIQFKDCDVLSARGADLRRIRSQLQMVFQDPVSSLNPRMNIGAIIGEGLSIHGLSTRHERRDRVAEALSWVGLSTSDLDRYPHEFSGGQRQRIGIARAIVLRPALVICDEPVSALDVSVQSQILTLLADLRDRLGMAYLFISHNMAVLKRFCDRIAVMYRGRIVEIAPAERLAIDPRHPYTQALIAATPRSDPISGIAEANTAPGRTHPLPLSSGCPYQSRCPLGSDRCRVELPRLDTRPGLPPEHSVACHHADPS